MPSIRWGSTLFNTLWCKSLSNFTRGGTSFQICRNPPLSSLTRAAINYQWYPDQCGSTSYWVPETTTYSPHQRRQANGANLSHRASGKWKKIFGLSNYQTQLEEEGEQGFCFEHCPFNTRPILGSCLFSGAWLVQGLPYLQNCGARLFPACQVSWWSHSNQN